MYFARSSRAFTPHDLSAYCALDEISPLKNHYTITEAAKELGITILPMVPG